MPEKRTSSTLGENRRGFGCVMLVADPYAAVFRRSIVFDVSVRESLTRSSSHDTLGEGCRIPSHSGWMSIVQSPLAVSSENGL
jgi:hypothetical protein